MDCQQALQILDLARPGENAPPSPEVAEALAHIEEHASCARIYHNRLRFDRQIAHIMQSAPEPPPGLKERLLAAVDAAARPEAVKTEGPPQIADAAKDSATQSVPSSPPARRTSSRRAVFRYAAVACAALLAGAALWRLMPGGPQTAPFAELRTELVANLPAAVETLPAWSGGGPPPLPRGWDVDSIRIEPPREWVGHPDPDVRVAVYPMHLSRQGRRGATFRGVLLVIPRRAVINPPQAGYFSAQRNVAYVGQSATVAWTSGEWVYVCVAPAAGNVLDHFEEALASPLS